MINQANRRPGHATWLSAIRSKPFAPIFTFQKSLLRLCKTFAASYHIISFNTPNCNKSLFLLFFPPAKLPQKSATENFRFLIAESRLQIANQKISLLARIFSLSLTRFCLLGWINRFFLTRLCCLDFARPYCLGLARTCQGLPIKSRLKLAKV